MKKLMVIIIMVGMLTGGCAVEHDTKVESYRINESYEENTIRIIKTEKR